HTSYQSTSTPSLSQYHRVLPTFPTRRSSDLARPGARARRGEGAARGAGDGAAAHAGRGAGLARAARGEGRRRAADPAARRRQDQDRKSTRLNSSHQITSYAVFCLKKEKRRYI